MRCDLRQFLQRQFYFFGTYWLEEEVLECWAEFARTAKVILDVGANAGIFSLVGLAASPDVEVHAFEPTPKIAKRLRDTVESNGLGNLHVQEVAVARTSGTAHLNVWEGEDGNNEGMNFVTVSPRTNEALQIRTVALDDFCREHGIERADLLKLDIQGNEAEALAGAERMFGEKRIGCVFVELNWAEEPGARCAASEVVEFLTRHGFEFALPQKNPSFRPSGSWMRTNSDIVARPRS